MKFEIGNILLNLLCVGFSRSSEAILLSSSDCGKSLMFSDDFASNALSTAALSFRSFLAD